MMNLQYALRLILLVLVVAAIGLPVVNAVLYGVSAILTAMKDEGGAAVVRGVFLAGTIVWITSLVLLVITLGVNWLMTVDRSE